MNKNVFFTDLDTSRSLVPNNFSNTITKDNPTQIFFRRSEKNLKYLFLSFVPNSEASLKYDIRATVQDQNKNVITSRTLSAENIYIGNSVNIPVEGDFDKGQILSLLLETDAAAEESGWRIPTGSHIDCDIQHWTYNGITDTQIMPGLHIVYNHFGVKTFAIWLFCAVAATVLVLFPKTQYHKKLNKPAALILFFTVPFINVFVSEMCNFSSIFPKKFGVILFSSIIALSIQIIFLAVFAHTGYAVISASFLMAVFSLANHYTRLFRGGVLTYFDVKVASTAANVISQYKFEADISVIICITFLILISVSSLRYSLKISLKNKILPRAVALVLGASIFAFSISDKAVALSGGTFYAFSTSDSAASLGAFFNFCHGISTAKLDKPDGYSTDLLYDKAEEYCGRTQYNNEKPDIILIMNETLTDFSKIVSLDTNTDPLEYIHQLENDRDPRTFVGSVITPVYGGGTCNSEFEALTGLSMANFQSVCYPHVQYITEQTYSYARYASSLGYDSTFIHPGKPNSYNRRNAYTSLGFDNILFADDFSGEETIRSFVSDRACYNKILDILNNAKNPQFIYNVTIQNHGSWDNPDFQRTVFFDNEQADNSLAQLEVLLTLYKQSDNAFKDFMEQINNREKPTLVIMFGDHLPALDSYTTAYLHLDNIAEQDPLAQYRTPVVIRANYDVDLSGIPSLFSTNYLSAFFTEAGGLPVSGFYSYLLQLADLAPVYSPAGISDAQGQPLSHLSAADFYKQLQYAALKEYKQMPYGFFSFEKR